MGDPTAEIEAFAHPHELMSDLEKEGIPRKRTVYLNFEAGAERPLGWKADAGRVRWADSCRERGASS
ncbi:hypothetical protein TRIP_B310018 [uncultured Desulfatiglans sp.]|nr:hypothetical protein TRIP_B310018 [uncultured Desulfatiglans sp.]